MMGPSLHVACLPRRTVGAFLMPRGPAAEPAGQRSATGVGLGGAWCHVPLDCRSSTASLDPHRTDGGQLSCDGTHCTPRSPMLASTPPPPLLGRGKRKPHVRIPCDCSTLFGSPTHPSADKDWSLTAALVCRGASQQRAKPAARRAPVPRCHPHAGVPLGPHRCDSGELSALGLSGRAQGSRVSCGGLVIGAGRVWHTEREQAAKRREAPRRWRV